MIKQEKAQLEVKGAWDYLKPSLINLTKFIAQKDRKINQGKGDKRGDYHDNSNKISD